MTKLNAEAEALANQLEDNETRSSVLAKQVKSANRMKEDAIKQARKIQSQLKDYQRELDEAKAGKDDLIAAAKEAEKKLKANQAEMAQMAEDYAASERLRRSLESERDKLQEELNSLGGNRSNLAEEKRRLEARIQQVPVPSGNRTRLYLGSTSLL